MLIVKNMTNSNNLIGNNKKGIESLKEKCLFNTLNANNRTFCVLIV